MAVQFCGSCGQPLLEDQLFCQHCGARNDENVHRAAGGRSDDYATRSAAAQPTDYATRAATPAAQRPNATPGGTMYCGECGFLLTAEDRACRRCGAPVEFPNALIASREISDAPTKSVNRPQSPAIPAPPPVNRAGVPWGAQQDVPPSDPQYSQVDIGYDAPTFATQAPYAGRVAAAPRQPPRAPVPPPGGPRRQRWPLVVALVVVALVMVVGGVVFLIVSQPNGSTTVGNPTATTPVQVTQSPTLTPSPTAVVLTTDTAKALIQQFFDDINARNYDAAYDLLSVEYQQNQTRQNFKDGFQTTVQDTIVINSAETLPDGTVEVDVTLTAVDNKNGSQVTTIFGGYYIVTLEGGQLRILRAKLNKQA